MSVHNEVQESAASVESVLVVDDHNCVLGVAPRRQIRQRSLCHRATYIFVLNSNGQLYVQKRALNKDIYPGYFDPATGGVVNEGESYDQSALRELEEELAIVDVHITSHFHFFFEDQYCRVWGRVYSCYYDGPITPQKDEMDKIIMKTPKEVFLSSKTKQNNYAPDSIVALERLTHYLK